VGFGQAAGVVLIFRIIANQLGPNDQGPQIVLNRFRRTLPQLADDSQVVFGSGQAVARLGVVGLFAGETVEQHEALPVMLFCLLLSILVASLVGELVMTKGDEVSDVGSRAVFVRQPVCQP
jgi:hypothetical protein